MSNTGHHDAMQLLAPLVRVNEHATNLENELRKEVSAGHVLFSLAARAVAQRTDNDDVLFETNSPDFQYAVVHLTWSNKPEHDPHWPETEVFGSLKDWIEGRMKHDNARLSNP